VEEAREEAKQRRQGAWLGESHSTTRLIGDDADPCHASRSKIRAG
jgi:hypothetical protein